MRAGCGDGTSIELKFQVEEDTVMFDVETLWADFARPIVSADD